MPTNQLQASKIRAELLSYSYPKLHTGKDWYVGFNAFDPATGKMKRKKIKVNHAGKPSERRKFSDSLMKRVIAQLENGWNPWIESESSNSYHTFTDVCTRYKNNILKYYNDGVHRDETYTSYLSYIHNMEKWNKERKNPIRYIYQFDGVFISDFIDHVYVERGNSPQTRNNYMRWVRMFCSWLVQYQYMKTKPSDGFVMIDKRNIKKQRTIIEELDMIRLKEHLEKTNKHFLLACYVLHYCFVRPKEMSQLKLENFSLKNQTLMIGGDISKNKKTAVVTLPSKVIRLMVELKIFDHPNSFYLFSKNCQPGEELHSEKQFRDYWSTYVRKVLKFPDTYKFYSLKDTGITNMLRKYDTITVRDQARHADILMTDTYTPHDLQKANEMIKNHDGNF